MRKYLSLGNLGMHSVTPPCTPSFALGWTGGSFYTNDVLSSERVNGCSVQREREKEKAAQIPASLAAQHSQLRQPRRRLPVAPAESPRPGHGNPSMGLEGVWAALGPPPPAAAPTAILFGRCGHKGRGDVAFPGKAQGRAQAERVDPLCHGFIPAAPLSHSRYCPCFAAPQ